MSTLKSLDTLTAEINSAVNKYGHTPKVTGPALNAVLTSLATELTTLPQVLDAGAGTLYATTGPATDGAMTQQATTTALTDKLSLSAPGTQTVVSALVLDNGGVDILKFYEGDLEGTAQTRLGWRATDSAATVDVGLMRQQAGVLKVVGTGTGDYAQLEAAELTAHTAPTALNSIGKLAAATTATQTRLDAPADLVGPTHGGIAYPTVYAATRAAQAGDTVRLHGPVLDLASADGEAVVDLRPDVTVLLNGHDVRSPSPNRDVVTLRGGRNVLAGGHATITQRPDNQAGGWLVGAYGDATLDAAIYDVHLRMTTYNSVGFALFATGTLRYRGNVTSVGRYVARLSPGTKPLTFSGEGTITQQDGTIFWLQNPTAQAEWRGDITARGAAAMNLEAGTVVLRQGIMRAEARPAGSETLVVKNGPGTTLILENYTVLGVPGAPVINVGTLILRGSSVVVGTIVADTILDERPAGQGAAAGSQVLEFVFETGFADEVTRTMGARQAGTYSNEQLNNVLGASYYLNGSTTPTRPPLTLAAADVLTVRLARQDASKAAVVSLLS
jgi:hypothetical protein